MMYLVACVCGKVVSLLAIAHKTIKAFPVHFLHPHPKKLASEDTKTSLAFSSFSGDNKYPNKVTFLLISLAYKLNLQKERKFFLYFFQMKSTLQAEKQKGQQSFSTFDAVLIPFARRCRFLTLQYR